MTEKEKIVKIICNMDSTTDTLDAITRGDVKQIADALIAAGIGDVSEYKHRAEVAENKLFDLAMFCTKGNRNFHGKSESEHEEEARKLFNEWLKQSEQELQEERK